MCHMSYHPPKCPGTPFFLFLHAHISSLVLSILDSTFTSTQSPIFSSSFFLPSLNLTPSLLAECPVCFRILLRKTIGSPFRCGDRKETKLFDQVLHFLPTSFTVNNLHTQTSRRLFMNIMVTVVWKKYGSDYQL